MTLNLIDVIFGLSVRFALLFIYSLRFVGLYVHFVHMYIFCACKVNMYPEARSFILKQNNSIIQ